MCPDVDHCQSIFTIAVATMVPKGFARFCTDKQNQRKGLSGKMYEVCGERVYNIKTSTIIVKIKLNTLQILPVGCLLERSPSEASLHVSIS